MRDFFRFTFVQTNNWVGAIVLQIIALSFFIQFSLDDPADTWVPIIVNIIPFINWYRIWGLYTKNRNKSK